MRNAPTIATRSGNMTSFSDSETLSARNEEKSKTEVALVGPNKRNREPEKKGPTIAATAEP